MYAAATPNAIQLNTDIILLATVKVFVTTKFDPGKML